jgi:biotin operon repressor
VSVVNDGNYSRKARGRLEGPNGTYISYIVPGGNDIEMSAYEHSTVHMDSVTLQTNDDGLLEAVIDDAVTVTRIGVTPETDTDTDDDADGDTDETDTETPETTESPDGSEIPQQQPQSSSDDTDTGEATADGGEIEAEAGDDADETDEMMTPDGLDKPDPNAPESQKRRIIKIKAKLRAAGTGDRNDFLTAEDLADELGWDRDIIDATIERLRRESNAMFGTPDEGWQMSK